MRPGIVRGVVCLLLLCAVGCGGGEPKDGIMQVTAPAAPTGLTVSALSTTSLGIAWVDASTNETGFKIERAPGGTSSFVEIVTLPANTASHADSGLAPDTDYVYRVRAYNSGGLSAFAGPMQGRTAMVPPPAAPTGLTVTPLSTTALRVEWNDASSDETGFEVERAPGGTSSFAPVASLAANTTLYDDSGLAPSTSYAYRVRAVNGSGPSGYAGPMQATTQAPPNAPPTANAGPNQGPLDPGGSVALSGSGSDPEGQPLSYAWTQTAGPIVAISSANSASASFTSLSRTTATYTFQLRVTDAGSLSAADSVSITTRVTYDNTVSGLMASRQVSPRIGCVGCHAPSPQGTGQSPSLRTYGEVSAVKGTVRSKLAGSGNMRVYLLPGEPEIIVGWIDNGAPQAN